MENEIIVGSNSDLIVQSIRNELLKINETVKVSIVHEFSDIESLKDGQLVIIDLSVYAAGILDRIEKFKQRFPSIELIAVTYTNDDLIDQMLVRRGIDQVTSREDLPALVRQRIQPPLQTTG